MLQVFVGFEDLVAVLRVTAATAVPTVKWEALARLGFEDSQMDSLLSEAGFDALTPTSLGNGELVVKIWIAHRRAENRKAAS